MYLFDRPRVFAGFGQPLRGIGWVPFNDRKLVAIFAYADLQPQDVTLGPLKTQGNFVVLAGADVDIADGRSDLRLLQPKDEFNPDEATRPLLRFLIATWLWLKQRVLVEQNLFVSSKIRTQAARARVASDVNTYVLRRPVENTRGEPAAVEWGCQWLVRGHWRQQFFPATKEHRPIWIHPHVKGPDGKPFKAPSTNVFTVER